MNRQVETFGPDATTLPAGHESLAFGVSRCVPATIFVLSLVGGMTLRPKEGREILLGRNRPDVHVCVGEDDVAISRVHGVITRAGAAWWLRTSGRTPLRLPGSRLVYPGEDPVALPEGYSPVFVSGTRGREHLVEIFVAGEAGTRPEPRHDEATRGPRPWLLTADERLVLTALGRRYLMHEAAPAPLSWRQVAELLTGAAPRAGWTAKKAEHAAVAVRNRLSRAGVPGLTREEVGVPVGNALNDNLIRELMASSSLIPPDLDLLEE